MKIDVIDTRPRWEPGIGVWNDVVDRLTALGRELQGKSVPLAPDRSTVETRFLQTLAAQASDVLRDAARAHGRSDALAGWAIEVWQPENIIRPHPGNRLLPPTVGPIIFIAVDAHRIGHDIAELARVEREES